MKFSDVCKAMSGRLVPIVLGIFFLVGGSINLVGPPPILAEYLLWGYPRWFHWVTGALELATASLMIRRRTRPYAAVLGSCVMFGAAATLSVHHAWAHALLPICIVLLLAYSSSDSLGRREKEPRSLV